MNPAITAFLTSLGYGQYALILAGIVGALSPLMTFLPVASAASAPWYRIVYGLLAWATFNFGKAAPVPANGEIAGGMVPTPNTATRAVIVPVSPMT
jgi:hypothetical protein